MNTAGTVGIDPGNVSSGGSLDAEAVDGRRLALSALDTITKEHRAHGRNRLEEGYGAAKRLPGFLFMREYGWQRILEDLTTLEEVIRVTSEDRSVE